MNSERGNREWLNEYMSLKQVNPNNPFTVPEGYFNELEQQIVSFMKLDELKTGSPSGFIVPENYFEELSTNINSRIAIEETLDKDATGGLTVPEGYFDELSQQIQSRIAVEVVLNEFPETFSVPEGYFDELSRQIQSRIMVGDVLGQSAEPFAVPEGYFNQLSENILNKTVSGRIEKPDIVKRRGAVRQLFSSSAFNYATAACLTLAVGATIFLSKNSSNVVAEHNSSFLHKSLSAIPVDDIKNYLQLNVDPTTDTRTLIDESKQVNADNLSDDLQDELDTSQ